MALVRQLAGPVSIAELNAHDAILDGEIVALEKGALIISIASGP
jgi:hypothetical protein